MIWCVWMAAGCKMGSSLIDNRRFELISPKSSLKNDEHGEKKKKHGSSEHTLALLPPITNTRSMSSHEYPAWYCKVHDIEVHFNWTTAIYKMNDSGGDEVYLLQPGQIVAIPNSLYWLNLLANNHLSLTLQIWLQIAHLLIHITFAALTSSLDQAGRAIGQHSADWLQQ